MREGFQPRSFRLERRSRKNESTFLNSRISFLPFSLTA
jgi:hypothetical protein